MNTSSLIKLPAGLVGTVAGLTLGAAASATPTGASLSYTPGSGDTPVVRGVPLMINADVRYQTQASEVRELLFTDGTTLVIGSASDVQIVQQPTASDEALIIRVRNGVVRIVAGKRRKQPIELQFPDGELSIGQSAVTAKVTAQQSVVELQYGAPVELRYNDTTTLISKAGFSVLLSPDGMTRPQRLPVEQSEALAQRVSTKDLQKRDVLLASVDQGLLPSTGPSSGDDDENSEEQATEDKAPGNEVPALADEPTDEPADEPVEEPEEPDPGEAPGEDPGSDPGGDPGADPGDDLGTDPGDMPEPPPAPIVPPEALDGVAGSGGGGFGPGDGADSALLGNAQPSQSNGDLRGISQELEQIEENGGVFSEPTRADGRTSNRLYLNSGFTQSLGIGSTPVSVSDPIFPEVPSTPNYDLRYIFTFDGLVLQKAGESIPLDSHDFVRMGALNVTAPVLFTAPASSLLNAPGNVMTFLQRTISNDADSGQGSFLIPGGQFSLLQSGFGVIGDGRIVTTRDLDNFLLLEIQPAKADELVRDIVSTQYAIDGDYFSLFNAVGLRVQSRNQGGAFTVDLVDDVSAIVFANLGDDVATDNALNTLLSTLPLSGGLNPERNFVRASQDALFGNSFSDPSADFNALAQLALAAEMGDADPVAFVMAMGAQLTEDVNFSLQQALTLADTLTTDLAGQALGFDAITEFSFLSSSQRSFIIANLNALTETATLSLDDSRDERFLFATGDVDLRIASTFVPTASIDHFFLSAGLTDFAGRFERTVGEGTRAFFRNETAFGLNSDPNNRSFTDSGLFVINPSSISGEGSSALLHVDAGLAGVRDMQSSTLSISLGELAYIEDNCGDSCQSQLSIEVIAQGQSIGSSRGTPEDSGLFSTVSLSSPFRSTSAGGGNADLGRDGYAGYLVLENYDPADGSLNVGDIPLLGGTEHPLGTIDDDVSFASLRLATAVGSETPALLDRTTTLTTRMGFAAGLGQRETDGALLITQVNSGVDASGVNLGTNATSNRAQFVFNLTDVGALQLGGLAGDDSRGASAFVDDDRFAARSLDNDASSQLAAVSQALVVEGLPDDMRADLVDLDYVQWGFFFGDYTINSGVDAGANEHVHMGTWVVGDPTNPADLPATGTASYTGHAIGEVFNGDTSYTATGSFSNSWDFGTRRGDVQMNFDGTSYSGLSEIQNDTSAFVGTLNADGREGGVFGSFVGNGSDPIAGEIGRFSIGETNTNEIYRASGTFAAGRDGE